MQLGTAQKTHTHVHCTVVHTQLHLRAHTTNTRAHTYAYNGFICTFRVPCIHAFYAANNSIHARIIYVLSVICSHL